MATITTNTTPSSSSGAPTPILSSDNYLVWKDRIKDRLQAKGLWMWVDFPKPPDETSDLYWKWKMYRGQAVGEIRMHCDPGIRERTESNPDFEWDPRQLINFLKDEYGQTPFAHRYKSLLNLIGTRQASDTAASFTARAQTAMHEWKSSRPEATSAKPYGLKELDDEILMIVLLGGADSQVVTTSLLTQDNLTPTKVVNALIESDPRSKPPSAAAASMEAMHCMFCGMTNHTIEQCNRMKAARIQFGGNNNGSGGSGGSSGGFGGGFGGSGGSGGRPRGRGRGKRGGGGQRRANAALEARDDEQVVENAGATQGPLRI